ncbi:hypothetical protein N864_16240 [Intrasporangium chromatireducens Q5-1]|uniref:DUF305 domain-containing protein n=2 Tax=Intrasporangium TaxID=53357 RepID=W9GJM8_9MICO|nr:hypothetical protein N864_16240 [Intrasporangium chromatireducens Q5-1]
MLVGALVVLVFVALAGFAGYQVGRSGDVPDEGGADVGFARDMQTHHNQAVHMALTIRDKTSDPTLRAVAYDIATSQSQQAGQLYGWLAHWGLPATSSDRPMAWMSAGQHLPEDAPAGSSAASSPPTVGGAGATGSQDGMPAMSGMPEKPASGQSGEMSMGMATTEQLKSLQRATGLQAERQFLTLMIAHHQGGVQMARAALRLATKPEVLTLARAIDTAQTAEIAQLQQLLEARR